MHGGGRCVVRRRGSCWCAISGVTTDITDRKEAESRQALLAREVDHRAKNALAVVQAIVRMAKRDNIEDYVKAVEGRIGALAQTHELLSQSRWEGADILRLILDELAPYHSDGAAAGHRDRAVAGACAGAGPAGGHGDP